jgi:dipeptidyl aminopeptidase/acylaminoacyl peptidase
MFNSSPFFGSIPLEELAGLPSFYLPTPSFDRKHVAFYWDKTGRLELYVIATTAGASPRKVSDGQLPKALHAGFCWTRDSKAILYAKDTDGDEQHNIWRMNIETGEAEQLTDNPKAQEYPVEVSPDNTKLLVGSNLHGQFNLYALDLATHEYTQLTDYVFPVFTGRWSPDGKQITYVTNETDNLKNTDVYLMIADGSDKKRIIQMRVGSQESISDWSDDGRYLSIQTDACGKHQVGVYEVSSGELRWFSPEDRETYAGPFSPDGKRVLGFDGEDAALNAVVYEVASGRRIDIELPPGMSFNGSWLDNDRFIVNIMTPATRPELRDYRLTDGASNVMLTAEYGSIDPKLFVNNEYIWYTSSDGLKIPAILYRPRHLEPGKKYPAIVEVHGGPTGQFFRGSFDAYAQFLTDNGYIVLQPNPRGSTGYGVEFRDMARNDWGGGDLEDIAAGAEYLKSLPEVDPSRLAVFGGSYGGYMTFMAMTKKPHLWKAGVAWVGISDLLKLYASSMEHFKYYLREQMGDPDQNADLWRDRSAINFVEHMTGKLLIIHGVNDPRCPIEQARVFRDRLLELGKVEGQNFEYVELGEEGHGSSDIQQKIRSYRLLVDFLQRSL